MLSSHSFINYILVCVYLLEHIQYLYLQSPSLALYLFVLVPVLICISHVCVWVCNHKLTQSTNPFSPPPHKVWVSCILSYKLRCFLQSCAFVCVCVCVCVCGSVCLSFKKRRKKPCMESCFTILDLGELDKDPEAIPQTPQVPHTTIAIIHPSIWLVGWRSIRLQLASWLLGF